MKFISENIIEKTLESISSQQEVYLDILKDITKNHPSIIAYTTSETFEVLTDDEKEFFLQMVFVIYNSSISQSEISKLINNDMIGMIEQENWEIFDAQKGKFIDKLNIFFENYDQEDLLAFVEDMLVEDEENPISDTGRAVMFIGAKTVIDILDECFREEEIEEEEL